MKLLMVCLGNICRSPLAEGIMKEKLNKAGMEFFTDSAGIINYHAGEAPDHRSIDVARNHGIDISGQVARKFTRNDFTSFDLIFAMDEPVYEELISLAKSESEKEKVYIFLDYAEWNNSSNVPDPYYGTKHDFEEVFRLLEAACDRIIEKFIKGK